MALLVFMYHRVLPQAHPEAVECGLFERELDLLQKKFRFLTPAQVEEYLRGKDFPEEKGDFAALKNLSVVKRNVVLPVRRFL